MLFEKHAGIIWLTNVSVSHRQHPQEILAPTIGESASTGFLPSLQVQVRRNPQAAAGAVVLLPPSLWRATFFAADVFFVAEAWFA
jgi:hypothetical protein